MAISHSETQKGTTDAFPINSCSYLDKYTKKQTKIFPLFWTGLAEIKCWILWSSLPFLIQRRHLAISANILFTKEETSGWRESNSLQELKITTGIFLDTFANVMSANYHNLKKSIDRKYNIFSVILLEFLWFHSIIKVFVNYCKWGAWAVWTRRHCT